MHERAGPHSAQGDPMMGLRSALDPRASVGAGVGWCVALPLSALWLADCWPPGAHPARLGWGLTAIAASSLAAAAIATRGWRRLQALIAARKPDDLAPLAACEPQETQVVIDALNRCWRHQHDAAERQKRMVADAAHQLRTPLAALRTLLQSTPPGALAPRVPDLLRAVDRATDVANEFLTQMKLEQRQAARPDWPVLQLDDVAREAALEFSPLIADKRLAFELDAVALPLKADAWMLGELLRNLLANAIGHTPPAAPLGIVVRHALGAPELIVWDSGPGISDAVRERVFEPFAAATRGSGVGLGLSICKQLASALGAEVQLFNRSDGERIVGVDAVVRWHPFSPPVSPPVVEGDRP